MEEFYLKVYLFKPNRVPPIKIAKDSQLKITIETMDYTIPPGSTASAFANGVTSEKVYTQSCAVSGNKVSFTPVPGFFVQGRNLLQYEIGGGVIPLAIDVNCEISLPSTGNTGEPEIVKPLVQRAEAAAATAEEKANAASGSADAAAGSAKAAQDSLEKTQEISVNPAFIGENGNWFVWSSAADSYVDSGTKAQGPQGAPGPVQTVCGSAPDESGNVSLNAGNVGALPSSGGSVTGPIDMGGNKVTNLGAPVNDGDAASKEYVDAIVAKIYPVGAIYISISNVSPAELFGGTWEQVKDVFLLAAGDTYAAGTTGGEAEHTLTIDEMPRHNHSFTYNQESLATGTDAYSIRNPQYHSPSHMYQSSYVGGGLAHNNMPPYLAVYVWKRVA